MNQLPICDLNELAAAVPDGAKLVLTRLGVVLISYRCASIRPTPKMWLAKYWCEAKM